MYLDVYFINKKLIFDKISKNKHFNKVHSPHHPPELRMFPNTGFIERSHARLAYWSRMGNMAAVSAGPQQHIGAWAHFLLSFTVDLHSADPSAPRQPANRLDLRSNRRHDVPPRDSRPCRQGRKGESRSGPPIRARSLEWIQRIK